MVLRLSCMLISRVLGQAVIVVSYVDSAHGYYGSLADSIIASHSTVTSYLRLR